MSLTIAKGEGVTVLTISSNPKSKWPLLCQILGVLCYSPVYSVSRDMTGKLKNTQTALGIVQIIVGVINIVVGIFLASVWIFNDLMDTKAPIWIGSVFLLVGIMCVLAAKFPSSCLLVIAMILNIFSAALAITAVVLCSVDLAMGSNQYCEYYSDFSYHETPSPEQRKDTEMCLYYKNLNQMILGGLDIMLIVFAVLQLCVTISFCVLTGKALCKKGGDAKSVEDPQIHKPLLEEVTASPAC
ncbi:transmembrane protein 176A-like [Myxocyprinus asiaticus]|uniref:transmembrane protein 176A-like n=1 Tax=Myxocyprinus asiaticus TaxID=70543 RepID=UPI0022237002|nr:transmembrane protein 176A-like [Myxocyprinus asiaticus]